MSQGHYWRGPATTTQRRPPGYCSWKPASHATLLQQERGSLALQCLLSSCAWLRPSRTRWGGLRHSTQGSGGRMGTCSEMTYIRRFHSALHPAVRSARGQP